MWVNKLFLVHAAGEVKVLLRITGLQRQTFD
jgi:hypothetical protein